MYFEKIQQLLLDTEHCLYDNKRKHRNSMIDTSELEIALAKCLHILEKTHKNSTCSINKVSSDEEHT